MGKRVRLPLTRELSPKVTEGEINKGELVSLPPSNPSVLPALPTVAPAGSRALTRPPTGALPRIHLAVSAAGSASVDSPYTGEPFAARSSQEACAARRG